MSKSTTRKGSESPWPIIVAVVLCLAIVGLVVFLSIVRKEGWEGLWAKKKESITNTQPGAELVVEEAEKRVKDRIK